MNINSVKLIYFSPTRTTRKIVEAIAKGIQIEPLQRIDLTPPDARTQRIVKIYEGLVIIGSPVYGGRLPAEAAARLLRLRGNGAPTAVVVVYGNRAYEDALLELRNIALDVGFSPIAAGAFIGEHSYSTDTVPVAPGRPDMKDLVKATEFGKNIHEKLKNMHTRKEMSLIEVPGNFPYKKRGLLSNISPVTQEALCAKCKACVFACPTAAIAAEKAILTNRDLCIRCCSCIRTCPTGARKMEDPQIRQLAEWLNKHCGERKEPETYI